MKIGIHLPHTEIGSDPNAIRDFAQAVEAMGYSQILMCDHILGADPDRPGGWGGLYTMNDAFHEPLVTMAYLAGVTERIEFMTSVMVLPQRQTALVAKQAAHVDLLSGGRIELGVGTGWNEVEYEALGVEFSERGKRQEEQIELMRLLWENPVVSFDGKYHRVDAAGINPLPTRRIPIWLGGGADVLLRRAARIADGWIPGGEIAHPYQAAKPAEKLRGYLEAEGRDPSGFPIAGGLMTMGGNPDRWHRHVGAWRDLGATHLYLWSMNAGLTTPDAHIEAAREFRQVMGEMN